MDGAETSSPKPDSRPPVCFVFDRRGHAGGNLPGQVPSEVAQERAARLADAIDRSTAAFWRAFATRELEVLVERGSGRRDGVVVGRCAAQAPDIDGRTFITGMTARRGQIVHAVCVDAVGYDVQAVAGSRVP